MGTRAVMAGAAARRGRAWLFAVVVLGVSGMAACVAWADSHQVFRVSQKDQAFQPSNLTIKLGDVVTILNDDGDVLHHAYVDSDKFKFDSGDQEPGTSVNIVFPATGTYTVLCGIHPRMKLRVHVDP